MNHAFGRIGVLGAGSWGTALALVAATTGARVTLWCRRSEQADAVRSQRENRDYLPGVALPEGLAVTDSLEALVDHDLLLVVVPSKAIREVAQQMKAAGLPTATPLLCCTKGIEYGSGRLMSEILEQEVGAESVAVLSGPNLAFEIARKAPTAAVVAAEEIDLARELQRALTVPWFRLYRSDDPRGVQLGGALKNVYAIGAGTSDGLGMGENAKAALVTRSLAEMIRLGVALGGKPSTFQGLSGIGDLMVTCFSERSRNHTFGVRLARGESPEQILNSMRMVAEGVPTARSAYEIARRGPVEVPVIEQIHEVLYHQQPPMAAIQALLSRALKEER